MHGPIGRSPRPVVARLWQAFGAMIPVWFAGMARRVARILVTETSFAHHLLIKCGFTVELTCRPQGVLAAPPLGLIVAPQSAGALLSVSQPGALVAPSPRLAVGLAS